MSIDLAKLVALAEDVEQRVLCGQPFSGRQDVRQSWFRIENATKPKVAEVFIYDEIGMWGVTAKDFVAEVRAIKASQIDLHINCYGGQVFDGVAIYNALMNHSAHILSIVDGVAASAASFIAMAGDEIEMEKPARMMIHDASGGVLGNAKDMREMADLLDGLSDTIAEIYADRAGGTIAEWRARMLAETWFTASEAVDLKLANRIAGDAPANTLPTSVNLTDTWPPAWLGDALKEGLNI